MQTLIAGIPSPTSEAFETPVYDCALCEDQKMVMVMADNTRRNIKHVRIGEETLGAVPCDCQMARIRAAHYAAAINFTPAEFDFLTDGLNSFVPNAKRHPKQADVLALVRAQPEDSLFIAGTTGTGKTAIAYALMQEAARRGRSFAAESFEEILAGFRTFEFEKGKIRRNARLYSIEQLTDSNTKFCIVIDEVEKANLSDYSLRKFFEIVKKAIDHKHQIIITANLILPALADYWERKDTSGKFEASVYSSAIVRRLVDYCHQIDLRLAVCQKCQRQTHIVGGKEACVHCGSEQLKWLL